MQEHSSAKALQFDVLIVGSGLAGLSTALLLSEKYRVAIITKRAVREGSSGWAQGGIAAVWDKADSFAAHVDDTLIAGAGLCDLAATQFVVEHAAASDVFQRQSPARLPDRSAPRAGGPDHQRQGGR